MSIKEFKARPVFKIYNTILEGDEESMVNNSKD